MIATHADYADRLAAGGRFCAARDQISAAIGLFPQDNDYGNQLATYESECAIRSSLRRSALETGSTTGQDDPDGADNGTRDLADAFFSGRLLYSILEDGHFRIYLQPLTGSTAPALVIEDGTFPQLAASTGRIAFFSTSEDQLGLYGFDLENATSPGGRDIRYAAFIEDARNGPPTWNGEGTRLAFSSTREGDRVPRIYIKWADSEPNERVIAVGKDPAWHPFQDLVVYNGVDETGNRPGLWAVPSSGEGAQRWTTVEADIRPTWSPEGRYLFFMSNTRDGNWELYRLEPAVDRVVRISNDPALDGPVTVSPDGRRIAFISDRGGQWAIWVADINGDNLQLFRSLPRLPDWRRHGIDWIE